MSEVPLYPRPPSIAPKSTDLDAACYLENTIKKEKIIIELTTSGRNLKAPAEGTK